MTYKERAELQQLIKDALLEHPEKNNHQIAAELNCGIATVRDWRHRLKLPAKPVGKPTNNPPPPKPDWKDPILTKPVTRTLKVSMPKTKRRGFYGGRYIDFYASDITGLIVDCGLETPRLSPVKANKKKKEIKHEHELRRI